MPEKIEQDGPMWEITEDKCGGWIQIGSDLIAVSHIIKLNFYLRTLWKRPNGDIVASVKGTSEAVVWGKELVCVIVTDGSMASPEGTQAQWYRYYGKDAQLITDVMVPDKAKLFDALEIDEKELAVIPDKKAGISDEWD